MANPTLQNPQALAQKLMHAANNLSDQEATQRYQQILAQLPPDQAAELNTLALNQVAGDERTSLARHFKQAHENPASDFNGYTYAHDTDAAHPASLAHMSVRAQQQDPALLGGILGNNSALGGQIGKAALAALAALLVRRMMSGQGVSSASANPIGSILGSLLGGGSGSGSQSAPGGDLGSLLGELLGGGGLGSQSVPQGGQSMQGGDLGSLLGGLLGGGLGTQSLPGGGQSMPQGGQSTPGGDLGSLLGGLLGGGAASQYTSQGGDMGSILGSILGGGAPAAPAPSKPGVGSHRKGVHIGETE